MKAVFMAGGKGTRITSVASDIPKPMIQIAGKPVLEHEIECLRSQGITDLIITISHLGHRIREYFGDGSRFGVKIQYFDETAPMGNAGALFKLKEELTEDFLLLNADVLFDVDLIRMIDYHQKKGGCITVFTHPNSHPYDSGLVVADENMAVLQWLTKEDERPRYYKNRVNAGIHIVNPRVLEKMAADAGISDMTELPDGIWEKVDLDRQILKPLAGTGKMFCYDSPEYVRDMGTPERYRSVEEDFLRGKVHAGNLKNRQKAVFLDRDGTLNKYVGFLTDIDDFELVDAAAEAVNLIHSKGYLCIVVTNQPVVARGEVTFAQLDAIHNKMETLLGLEGAYIDGLYYCPHHPHKGYPGEVAWLKTECSCRKPRPGMLLRAAEEFNICLSDSWMAGDGENDILAGKNAGCRTALIGSGEGKKYGQDMNAESLLHFAQRLC
ncbi:MAG TPA: HAD-IIIA family hydrolase [Candidatus Eisenbergiella merdavium]|uniref:HAD-IIIA family hydrolase n=1 Tax=Candidatus Eisenbergiella merdavium TaxID=2838551 RepID=A0A9D2NI95_9FIRM|nr:HAD-IIIA family hydrolase [Candidatus Eisenbergiella merdavium]